MSVRRGTYALFVTFGHDEEIAVGALGTHLFRAGMYCYVGSAMGGIDQRVSRHLAHAKKIRWHIDYLTVRCDSAEAWISYPDPISECQLGRIAADCGGTAEMEGFGCSDCGCRSHLYRIDASQKAAMLKRARLSPFVRPGQAGAT